jgi:hypothetical protein
MKRQLIKSFGLMIVLLTFSATSFGQVYKLKSTSFSSKYKINDYRWSEWSEASETSVLITFDLNKERITIYSKTTQVYDIAKDEGKTTDEDGDDFYSYYCVNKDGLTCRVKLAKLNSQNGRNQVYVDFSDMRWVYNVYSLD